MYKTVVIAGGHGVGKGTQCKLLAKRGDFFHLSTGYEFELLKDKAKYSPSKLSPLEREIVETNVNGNYVPDELVLEFLGNALAIYRDEGTYVPDKQLLLADGFPRTEPQRISLEKSGLLNIESVILLEAPKYLLMKRMLVDRKQEGRNDDKFAEERLRKYEALTLPMLQNYGDKLIRIDTTPPDGMDNSIQLVHGLILASLGLEQEDDDDAA